MPCFTRFMNLEEVLLVLKDLERRQKRSVSSRLNMMIFTFSCCCGLRRGEISGLKFTDLVLTGARPCILIRKENSKGRLGKRRSRNVPLTWDAKTLERIREWVEVRKAMGATASDPVVCGTSEVNRGKRLTGRLLARRWKTAIRCLGPERIRQLSVHCGRHSYASLSFEAGHSLVEVKEAMGHASIATTSIYMHAVSRDVPDVFAA